ncbi:hypothetical protein ACJIZ3_007071 [Penstemon smallii]|uniref:Uncharacterized protein n=1 Tax=Penstemon smallii TaxID=265156 RepID=A0ABD3S9G9_9LAMI
MHTAVIDAFFMDSIYSIQRRKAEVRVTDANASIVNGPAIHPSCDILHAKDSTPEPITAVIICAKAVHIVPDPSLEEDDKELEEGKFAWFDNNDLFSSSPTTQPQKNNTNSEFEVSWVPSSPLDLNV